MAGPREARDPAIHVLSRDPRIALGLASLVRSPIFVMAGLDPAIPRFFRETPGSR